MTVAAAGVGRHGPGPGRRGRRGRAVRRVRRRTARPARPAGPAHDRQVHPALRRPRVHAGEQGHVQGRREVHVAAKGIASGRRRRRCSRARSRRSRSSSTTAVSPSWSCVAAGPRLRAQQVQPGGDVPGPEGIGHDRRARHGRRRQRLGLRPRPRGLDYTLQTDTDLAFVDELCRRSGFDWEVDGTTFHAWKSPALGGSAPGPAVTLTVGETLRSFSAKVHADAPASVTVRGWDHLNKKEVVGGVDDPSVGRAARPREARPGVRGQARPTVLDSQANPVDPAEAKTLAEGRCAPRRGAVLARGRERHHPRAQAGRHRDGPGRGARLRELLRARGGAPSSDPRASTRPSSPATGSRARSSVTAAGPARGPSFRHPGLVVGVVTAIDDDPDAAGRVKVSLPGLDPTIESQWARLAVLGGGKERGIVFLPEVNDEVLVGFEGGDVRRPVVLGGLFGKKDKIPTGLVENGAVTHRRLTSRLGHVVELGDGTSAEQQHIRLELGRRQGQPAPRQGPRRPHAPGRSAAEDRCGQLVDRDGRPRRDLPRRHHDQAQGGAVA